MIDWLNHRGLTDDELDQVLDNAIESNRRYWNRASKVKFAGAQATPQQEVSPMPKLDNEDK